MRIGVAALVKNNVIGSITKLKKNNSVYFLPNEALQTSMTALAYQCIKNQVPTKAEKIHMAYIGSDFIANPMEQNQYNNTG